MIATLTRIAVCAALALSVISSSFAKTPWANVVVRSTGDRWLDLTNRFIQKQQFDKAVSLCEDQIKKIADPNSDASAKWRIQLSRVLSHQRMTQPVYDQQDVTRVQQPVESLLVAYPDHPRRLFLQSQKVEVLRDAARHDVVLATISPSDLQLNEAASARLQRAARAVRAFAEEVDQARADLDARQTDVAAKAMSKDLIRLQSELQIDFVSMTLMQTDLCSPNSLNQTTAANRAERAADEVLALLPTFSRARLEIERLRVHAIILGGQLDRGETALIALSREAGKPTPARIRALQTRLLIEQGELSKARQLIDLFQKQPASVPSIEMDLVQLDWMIRSKDPGIGAFLDTIETRHGAYARRRAEAISLINLGRNATTQNVDPSIVAAQGKEWLRRGNPARAAELLFAAASAEPVADRAITRGLESAAAFLKAGLHQKASLVLAKISEKHSQVPKASIAHLQAAVVLSQSKTLDTAKDIEGLLNKTNKIWPESESAASARAWLLKLYERQNRKRDAAMSATSFLTSQSDGESIDKAMQRWFVYVLSKADKSKIETRLVEFVESWKPKLKHPEVGSRYAIGAGFLLDAQQLAQIPASQKSTSEQDAAAAFLAFRRGESAQPILSKPLSDYGEVAVWRLLRDGEQAPDRRSKIAPLLSKWVSDSPLDRAKVMVWSEQIDDAIKLASEIANQSDRPATVWQTLATALAESDSAKAHAEAIKIWDRLSNGLPKGSDAWHDAKLSAISVLKKSRQTDESSRRAKYILLTSPPRDAELLRRYRGFAGK